MADVHDPATRSYNMSQIKAKNTKPEVFVRKFLHNNGLRFRLHDRNLPGKPDIVLKKHKTVIFVHGCFWHGHDNCRYFVTPKTNAEFWLGKINGNKERDRIAIKLLKKDKWKVIQIWECQIKAYDREKTMNKMLTKLTS